MRSTLAGMEKPQYVICGSKSNVSFGWPVVQKRSRSRNWGGKVVTLFQPCFDNYTSVPVKPLFCTDLNPYKCRALEVCAPIPEWLYDPAIYELSSGKWASCLFVAGEEKDLVVVLADHAFLGVSVATLRLPAVALGSGIPSTVSSYMLVFSLILFILKCSEEEAWLKMVGRIFRRRYGDGILAAEAAAEILDGAREKILKKKRRNKAKRNWIENRWKRNMRTSTMIYVMEICLMLHGNVVVHCVTLADAYMGQTVLARRVLGRYVLHT